MAIYEYVCDDCEILWEKEYPLAKNPSRTRCPKCNKLREKNWSKSTPVHFKGAGWTGKNSVTGFNKRGGSDEINLKLQEGCKERMKSGWQHYSKYTPKKAWVDKNVVKEVSVTEAKRKMEASKQIFNQAYDKAGIDRKDSLSKKPQ
jgi:putative FmdB family regulatory protein